MTEFDTEIEGILTPGTEDDLYRFNGVEGQKLFLDDLAGSGLRWTLYKPDRTPVIHFDRTSFYDKELYLPETGEYLLAMDSSYQYFIDTFDYRFEIITPTEVTTPLGTLAGTNESPQSIIGSIVEKGEEDLYTFEGFAGQQILLDTLDPHNHTNLNATLTSPDGHDISVNGFNDLRDDSTASLITLTQDGTYTLGVDGVTYYVGDYHFNIVDVGQAAQTIGLDTRVSGTLSVPLPSGENAGREMHVYQFTGRAGEHLYFDTLSENVGSSLWHLYDSSGERVKWDFSGGFHDSGFASRGLTTDMEIVLDHTDTYTLVIAGDATSIEPLDYEFEIITPTTQDQGIIPLASPSNTNAMPVSGVIGEKGEWQTYTFTGQKGQTLYLDDLDSHSSSQFQLESPSQDYWNSAEFLPRSHFQQGKTFDMFRPLSGQDQLIELPEDGEYTITVRGSAGATEAYNFQLIDVEQAATLSAGSPVNDAIAAHSSQFYQVNANDADQIYFNGIEEEYGLYWSLYDADFQTLYPEQLLSKSGTYNLGDFELVDPIKDVYYLRLNNTTAVPIDFGIQRVDSDATPAPIALNTDYVGEIEVLGDRDRYTFSGQIGEQIFITPTLGSDDIHFTLISPSGKEFDSVNTDQYGAVFTLTEAGDYQVRFDGEYDALGQYGFAIKTTSPMGFDVAQSGNLSSGETDIYTLTGREGQKLAVDTLTGGSNINIAIYDQTGEQLYTGPAGSSITVVDDSGDPLQLSQQTYVVYLTGTGNYDFKLSTDIGAAPISPATFETLNWDAQQSAWQTSQSTVSIPPDENKFYQFSGQAGQSVWFDTLSYSYSHGGIRLHTPSGDVVSTPLGSLQFDGDKRITLTETGNYYLEIENYSTTSVANSSFQILTSEALSAETDNLDESISLNPYETKVYKINGQVGQKLWLNGASSLGSNAEFRFYRPNETDSAAQLSYTYSQLDEPIVLDQEGEYYLTVESQVSYPLNGLNFQLFSDTHTTTIDLDNSPVLQGSFGNARQDAHLYKFVSTKGEHVYFDQLSGSSYHIELFTPAGEAFTGLSEEPPLALPADGEYLLAVYGYGSAADFTLQAFKSPEPIAQSLNWKTTPLGESVTGLLTEVDAQGTLTEPGEQHLYTFTGTENQRIWFDGLSGQTGIRTQLISPSGLEIWNGQEIGDDSSLDHNLTTLPEAGTYQLRVYGQANEAGDYSFRVVDVDQAPSITEVGSTIPLNGDFGNGSAARVYRFDANAGQTLYFDHHSGSYDYNLYGPDGQSVLLYQRSKDGSTSNDDNVTVPKDGEYTLVIQGTSGNSYSFDIVSPDLEPAVPLTIGDVVSGVISEPGEIDTFEFTGTVGQHLWFDNLLASPDFEARIYTPTGEEIRTAWGLNYPVDVDPFQEDAGYIQRLHQLVLSETGTYRLEIDPKYDNTGDYNFQLLDWAVNPRQIWDTTTDSIHLQNSDANPNGVNIYQFSGVEGERLFLNKAVDNATLRYKIYDSDGYEWWTGSQDGWQEFEQSGDYTLVLSDTSSYDLTLFTAEVSTTGYTLGDTISADLSEPGEKDQYTFYARPGQQIWVDGLSSDDPDIVTRLISPSGQRVLDYSDVDAARDRSELYTLNELGTYTLEVEASTGDRDVTGNYSLRLLDVGQAASPAPDADGNYAISGDLSTRPTQSQVYHFEGRTGQPFYVKDNIRTAPGDSHSLYSLKLIQPNGTALNFPFPNYDGDQEVVALPQDGDYWLVVEGQGGGTAYDLEIYTANATPTELGLGTVTSGELTKWGQQDVYTFEGAVGQKLFFDNQAFDEDLTITLYKPTEAWNSQEVLAGQSVTGDSTLTLDLSGTYRLVVEGRNDAEYLGATYQFQLSDSAQAPTLVLDTPYAAQNLAPETTQLYQFEGLQGQQIRIAPDSTSASDVMWTVYDPGNRAIAEGTGLDALQTVLPMAGNYTLAITNPNETALDYGFSATEVTNTPVINDVNRVVDQAVLTSSPETYTLTANAGTQIVFRRSGGSWGSRGELIAPDGTTQVFSQSATHPITAVLPQTGDYQLKLYGGVGSTQNFDLLELTPFGVGDSAIADLTPVGNNDLDIGTVISDSLENYGTSVYTIQGTVGQEVLLDGIGNGSQVYATLFKPNGEELLHQNLSNFGIASGRKITTLTEEGSYQLVITSNASSNQPFSFQLLDVANAPEIVPITPISGSIPAKQKVVYKVNAEAGQTLFLDAENYNYFQYAIYGPDNEPISVPYGSFYRSGDYASDVLTQSGEYTIVLDNTNTTDIDYSFQVFLDDDLPPDLLIPGDGEASGSDEEGALYFPVTVEATDNISGVALQDYTIRLLPDPENNAPVIVTTAPERAGRNQTYRYQLNSVDADGDTLKYRLVDGPIGASINKDTGELLWFADQSDAGPDHPNYSFTVEVSDGRGGVDQQTFSVELHEALGSVRGAVFEDYNQDQFRNGKLVKGDNPGIVYVIDVSGSTHGRDFDFETTDLEDAYRRPTTVLDMEIASALMLNQQMIDFGKGETSKVAAAWFNAPNMGMPGAGISDIDPRLASYQTFSTPSADLDGDGTLDLIQAIDYGAGGGTAFGLGLYEGLRAIEDMKAADPTLDANLVFLTDGYGGFSDEIVQLAQDLDVNISAFAIWSNTLESLQKIDPDAAVVTSKEDLFNIFGGWDDRFYSEPWMEDIQVYLDLDNDGELDPEEPWQYTTTQLNEGSVLGDSPYYYRFDGLVPGEDYAVRVVIPEGYDVTLPSGGTHTVTISDTGETIQHYFSLYQQEEVPNQAPTFVADAPTDLLTVGEEWQYQTLATDPDADYITYSLSIHPDGMGIDPETGVLTWEPKAEQVGYQTVIIKADDGNGNSDLQVFTLEVLAPNHNPVFTSEFPELTPQVGRPFGYTLSAIDPDTEDTLTYEVVSGADPSTITGDIFTWTPSTTGEQTLTFKVSDGKGGEDLQTVTVDVAAFSNSNSLPQFESTPRATIRYGSLYAYTPQVTDADGDILTYSLNSEALALEGLNFDTVTGQVVWLPTPNQFGPQTFELTVNDGQGEPVMQSWTVEVLNTAPNNPPEIITDPAIYATLDQPYKQKFEAIDPDGDTVFWSLGDSPNGVVIDATTGNLIWQPTPEQVGNHEITVRAVDTSGIGQELTYLLTVRGGNTPPQFTTHPETEGAEGQTYFYDVNATDLEGEAIAFSLSNAPEGVEIDEQTGLITWTAPIAGSHEITVLAKDTSDGFQEQTYTLDVVPLDPPTPAHPGGTPVNLHAPAITSIPIFAATTGETYVYDVVATDADSSIINYELLNTATTDFPDGLAIDAQGQITWTNPVVGSYTIVVGVNDGELGAAQQYTLTVFDNQDPVITSTAPTAVVPGGDYVYDLKAQDPEGQALTYTIEASPENQAALAAGIAIDELGRIRWTPGEEVSDTLSFTVTVRDPLGGVDTETITIDVAQDEVNPEVTLRPIGNISTPDPSNNPNNYDFEQDISQGDTLTFQVIGTDDVELKSLQLTAQLNTGEVVPVSLDARGVATVAAGSPGDTLTMTAIATDTAGNTDSKSLKIGFFDSLSTAEVTVELNLDSLKAEAGDTALVSKPMPIYGTVLNSEGDTVSYKLEAIPLDGSPAIAIFEQTNVTEIDGSAVDAPPLGTFDPSLLPNNGYTLRLTASESNGGSVSFFEEQVDVNSELKLGNFQLSFTDLTVPVSGIPITVTRTYDSLTAHESDNFGHGWRLEFRDMNLQTSLPPQTEEQELLDQYPAFRDGSKVYITLPGGEREAFTFQARPHHLNGFITDPVTGEGGLFYPEFVSEDGSGLTLSVKNETLARTADGAYSGRGISYNPADSNFGGTYTLTTKEGIEYEIDAKTGDLNKITDLNGNTLTYTEGGIKSSNGVEVTFERDAEGRIKKVIDPAGEAITYDYDDDGDLVSVTDRENNETEFFYEETDYPHYLTRIEDPLGRDGIRSEYDPETGRLKRMIDVNGELVELDYDPDNSLQKVTDIYGEETTYIYDDRGNVLQELHPNGLLIKRTYKTGTNYVETETTVTDESGPDGWTMSYTYDANGNVLSETDANGETTYYTYGAYSRLLTETNAAGETTTYTYSPSGNLRSSEDSESNVTTYWYDLRGNLLSLVDASEENTHFGYDFHGKNLTSVTDANGEVTEYRYDAYGNRTHEIRKNVRLDEDTVVDLTSEWIYDSEGRLLYFMDAEKYDPNRDPAVEPAPGAFTTKYEYDANGNQTKVTDAQGRVTESIYDEKGQLVATLYPDATPDDNTDNLRSITVYDKGGRERASIDGSGTITHYEYNEMGELVKTFYGDTDFAGFRDELLVGIDGYDPSGDVGDIDWTKVLYTLDDTKRNPHVDGLDSTSTTYTQDGRVASETDARENTTTFVYNSIGQLVETIYPDPDPTDSITDYSVGYTYDKAGRRLTETDANDNTTTYKYDELGRVTEVHFADETFTKTEYDELGRRTAFVDPEGIRTEYEYDKLGRLTAVVQTVTDAETNAIEELRTTYEYDELGRLIAATDAKDQVTRYEYDEAGRRSAVIRPGGERSEMTYHPDGSLKRATEYFNTGTTNPEAMTYDYDEQGRLLTKKLVNDPDVHYRYTDDGQVSEIRVGDDPNAADTEVTSFKYDEQGRLVGRKDPDAPTFTSDAGEFSIFYTYDAAGNVESVQTEAGTTEYTYDAWNRLKTVKQAGDAIPTTYVYDAAGNLVQTTFPNGVVEVREYDALNRLTVLTTTNDAGQVIAKSEYELNDAGHRTRVIQSLWDEATQALESETTDYTYDELYRLIAVETVGGDGVSYTYDEVGNRTSMLVGDELTTYVYDANDQLDSVMVDGLVTVDYEYDPDGNLIREVVTGGDTLVYSWDDQNRLVAVAKEGEAPFVTYEYDDDNIRVSQTVEGETTEFVVDKNRAYAQVLAEYLNDSLVAEYVYGLDLIEQEDGSGEAFFGVDGLGSTVVLTDEDGEVIQTYEYDEFGELEDVSGELATDYLFAGEQFDEVLGDYYLRQRFYDPTIGRFMRRDTYEGRLSEPITLNKFVYGNSNPVSYVDPSGLFSLAEVSAARKIRNTLAEIQFDSYFDLARNVDSDGVGGQVTGFIDKARGAGELLHFSATEITQVGALFAIPLSQIWNKVVKFKWDSFAKLGAKQKKTANDIYDRFLEQFMAPGVGKPIHQVRNVRNLQDGLYEIKHKSGVRVYIDKHGNRLGYSMKGTDQDKTIKRLKNLLKELEEGVDD